VASTNFVFQDVLDHVREQLNDDAQRRWDDTDILNRYLPAALQQLRADRPDLFIGSYGTENYKPSALDPLPFDDAGFSTLVEALIARIRAAKRKALARARPAWPTRSPNARGGPKWRP
jgi:hypothetical protein